VQNINLDLDRENELVFKLSVEGTRASSVKSRFLIESDKFSLFFPASSTSRNEVTVSVPPLENIISEGQYTSSLEVIIDDKVFTPMSLNTEFKKTISVVAEVVERKTTSSGPMVSSIVSVNRKEMDLSKEKDKDIVENAKVKTASNDNKKEALKENNRKRPAQRSRTRPLQNRMTKQAKKRKVLEETIRELSSHEGANLTEKQILKVVNFLKNKDKK
tara:strand:+ start:1077 stop:1727 length:651 start_codon:yes stop_codon:yes gene_type:complete